jgi:sugar/nucleoside kinase (ribokinase family)
VPAFHTLFGHQEKAHDETSAKEEPTLRIKGVNVKKILDPTGCGNTFCGGFLAGWYKSHDLLTAALWGSIAASFMLEYEGLPPLPMSQWKAEAQLRLELLHPHATELRFA